MTPVDLPPPVGPPLSLRRPPRPGWRWGWLAVLGGTWAGALVGSVATRGVPLQREQVLAWIVAALVVVATCGPERRLRQVLLDWLPFVAVLVLYDYSRGLADEVGFGVHWDPQVRADRWLFGGTLPTAWLQDHLYDRRRTRAWEVVPALVYASHFVVPFVVAAVLWVRDRPRWAAFTRRFVVLSFLGVATFVLFPAAPPWLAWRAGHLAEPVGRPLGRGWSVLGLHVAGQVLSKGQASVNLTAAIPSLHAAYAALVAVVLWARASWWARTLLAAYAVAMGFVLVLGGEHYVVDVLVGWAYVAVVVAVVGRVERRWARRRAAAPPVADQQASVGVNV